MSYYQALGLSREPFSNSPDPDLLYRARTHLECLQHMEIAVRLRRGLNVVLGEVGTGKTTLGRELARLLAEGGDIEVHFLDDPYQPTPLAFLQALARLFGLDPKAVGSDAGLLREALKARLRTCGQGDRIVALIVDEGQKMTAECLELLRELLNVETNTHKLLQIVIFAQTEFEDVLAARPNLDDRVNFRYRLLPLDRVETRRMIETRLALCMPDGLVPPLFTPQALRRIHRLAQGYPRKIVRLCHLSMLLAVGFGKSRINWGLVGRAARQSRGRAGAWFRPATVAGALGAAAVAGILLYAPARPLARQACLDVLTRAVASLESRTPVPVAAKASPATVSGSPDVAEAVTPADTPKVAAESLEAASREPRQATATTETGETAPDRAGEGVAAWNLRAEIVPRPTPALPPDAPEHVIVVAAEEAGSEAPAKAVATVDDTASLGACVVRPGWTVSRLAARLYGNGGRHVLSVLAKANPGIDFSRIRAGESLVYPAITAKAPPAGAYLVRVASVTSLEQGFAAIVSLKEKQGLAATLYCTGHPDTGLRFDVVLPDVFPNQGAAGAALAALPAEVVGKAVPVSGYPSGTTFFTDLGDKGHKQPAGAPVPVRQVAETRAAPAGTAVQEARP